jgi:hypothetical protein
MSKFCGDCCILIEQQFAPYGPPHISGTGQHAVSDDRWRILSGTPDTIGTGTSNGLVFTSQYTRPGIRFCGAGKIAWEGSPVNLNENHALQLAFGLDLQLPGTAADPSGNQWSLWIGTHYEIRFEITQQAPNGDLAVPTPGAWFTTVTAYKDGVLIGIPYALQTSQWNDDTINFKVFIWSEKNPDGTFSDTRIVGINSSYDPASIYNHRRLFSADRLDFVDTAGTGTNADTAAIAFEFKPTTGFCQVLTQFIVSRIGHNLPIQTIDGVPLYGNTTGILGTNYAGTGHPQVNLLSLPYRAVDPEASLGAGQFQYQAGTGTAEPGVYPTLKLFYENGAYDIAAVGGTGTGAHPEWSQDALIVKNALLGMVLSGTGTAGTGTAEVRWLLTIYHYSTDSSGTAIQVPWWTIRALEDKGDHCEITLDPSFFPHWTPCLSGTGTGPGNKYTLVFSDGSEECPDTFHECPYVQDDKMPFSITATFAGWTIYNSGTGTSHCNCSCLNNPVVFDKSLLGTPPWWMPYPPWTLTTASGTSYALGVPSGCGWGFSFSFEEVGGCAEWSGFAEIVQAPLPATVTTYGPPDEWGFLTITKIEQKWVGTPGHYYLRLAMQPAYYRGIPNGAYAVWLSDDLGTDRLDPITDLAGIHLAYNADLSANPPEGLDVANLIQQGKSFCDPREVSVTIQVNDTGTGSAVYQASPGCLGCGDCGYDAPDEIHLTVSGSTFDGTYALKNTKSKPIIPDAQGKLNPFGSGDPCTWVFFFDPPRKCDTPPGTGSGTGMGENHLTSLELTWQQSPTLDGSYAGQFVVTAWCDFTGYQLGTVTTPCPTASGTGHDSFTGYQLGFSVVGTPISGNVQIYGNVLSGTALVPFDELADWISKVNAKCLPGVTFEECSYSGTGTAPPPIGYFQSGSGDRLCVCNPQPSINVDAFTYIWMQQTQPGTGTGTGSVVFIGLPSYPFLQEALMDCGQINFTIALP